MKRTAVILAAILVVCVAGAMLEWSRVAPVVAEQQEIDSYEHRDGKKEAEADIAKGTPKWKVYGRVSEYDVRKVIAKEKLGLELDWFAGCLATEAIERYAFDYNSTIRPHLVAIHGEPSVFSILGEPPQRRPAANDEKG